MARLVMKFGGTSSRQYRAHPQCRPPRPARGGRPATRSRSSSRRWPARPTNSSPGAARPLLHDAREYDAVVASGEQVTAGLLAIALQDIGIAARSWQGWQIPILTDDAHGSARILSIDGAACRRFAAGEVAVVAGFQGLHKETGRVTTLGRGGSDTGGRRRRRHSRRPVRHLYRRRRRLYDRSAHRAQGPPARRSSFEEMLEMASLGAKVLQVRSVELAMLNRVKTFVRSSFDDPADPKPGTLICDEEDIVEQQVVTGIAYSKDEAQITLRRIADKPGVAAAIFVPLAEANINVDMIIQVVSDDTTTTDLTFTVPAADFERAIRSWTGRSTIGYAALQGAMTLSRFRRSASACAAMPASPRVPSRRWPKRAQYPRHHHVRNQILGADRCRLYRARGAHPALALRAGREGVRADRTQRDQTPRVISAESGNIRSREQIACPSAGSAPCPFDWGQGIWRPNRRGPGRLRLLGFALPRASEARHST